MTLILQRLHMPLTRTTILLLVLIPLLQGCAAHKSSAERVPAPASEPTKAALPSAPLAKSLTDADASATRVSNLILGALIEANGVPGMGAAVWRNGEVIWTGSAGYRDLERKQRVDADTIFRLASVSKVFAVTAAAKLKEQGSLNTDAPVRSIVRYLPDQWPVITATQLAAHTSGIPHYQAMDAHRGGHRFATVREAVGVFQDRDLLFAPQARYHYSSYGYTLLTAMVEEVSGKSYLAYLSQEIVPGLKVGPDLTDTDDPNASKAYEFKDGAIRRAAPHDYSYSWGGAGLGATAPDLARFGGRMMTGEIVSPDTFQWMLLPARLKNGSNVMDGDNAIGFGWRSSRDADGERIAHHAGVTNGARSALILYPDRKLAVSLLSNALWVSSIEQTALMLAAPFKAMEVATVVPCPTKAVAYKGEYAGAPVAGTARVVLEEGVCTAVITPPPSLREWLNGFPQNDAATLKIIGIDPRGGFARAALVTPTGLYDFRTQGTGDRHVANFGGTRVLSIRFDVPQ